jgi:hypothetical protein
LQLDFICNWLGNQAWTLQLQWNGATGFNNAPFVNWTANGAPAGVVRSFNGFTFLRVYNAGHMVCRQWLASCAEPRRRWCLATCSESVPPRAPSLSPSWLHSTSAWSPTYALLGLACLLSLTRARARSHTPTHARTAIMHCRCPLTSQPRRLRSWTRC